MKLLFTSGLVGLLVVVVLPLVPLFWLLVWIGVLKNPTPKNWSTG